MTAVPASTEGARSSGRRVVAVAGASGFVGRALLPVLARRFDVVGISRRAAEGAGEGPPRGPISWRRADLFSLLEGERALEGADMAVYLVRAAAPGAALTQASSEDLELIAADNFARAARRTGVGRIVTLGGIVPPDPEEALSPRHRSRVEVERTLRSRGTPVTALRARPIAGAGADQVRALGRRSASIRSAASRETPARLTALDDVVGAIALALEAEGCDPDIGGRDVPTRSLQPEGMGERPPLPGRGLHVEAGRGELGLERARPEAPTGSGPPESGPPDVRSVQRLPLPPGWTARDVTHAYVDWLPRFMRPLIEVVPAVGGIIRFNAGGTGQTLLELTLSGARSTDDRALLYVTGGLLTVVDPSGRRRGRLEFREVLGRSAVIAAIHDFAPRMPWFLYKISQAPLHLHVMESFGRFLARCGRLGLLPPGRGARGTAAPEENADARST